MSTKHPPPTREQLLEFIEALSKGVPLPQKQLTLAEDIIRPLWQKTRQATGLARYERTCRVVTHRGRRVRAYRVPGSYEATVHAELHSATVDAFERTTKQILKGDPTP